jgi:hypothetical protein
VRYKVDLLAIPVEEIVDQHRVNIVKYRVDLLAIPVEEIADQH